MLFLFCVRNQCEAQQSGKTSKQNNKNSNAGLNASNDKKKFRENDETPFCTSGVEEKCSQFKSVRKKISVTWIQMNAASNIRAIVSAVADIPKYFLDSKVIL